MSTQITLTLPDTVYGRAESLAYMTGQSVADVLVTTITLSLPELSTEDENNSSVEVLSDAEVLSLADAQMEPDKAQQLSKLLDRQQAGVLSEAERARLHNLMHHYNTGLLRKAQALQEAVRRGLRSGGTSS